MEFTYRIVANTRMPLRRTYSSSEIQEGFVHYQQATHYGSLWGLDGDGLLVSLSPNPALNARYHPEHLGFGDYTLQLIFGPAETPGHQIGLIFRYQDRGNFYFVGFDCEPESGWQDTPARLYRVRDGQWELLADDTQLLEPGLLYDLTVEASGPKISVYLRRYGQVEQEPPIFEVEDPEPVLTGAFGPAAYAHPGARFMNLSYFIPSGPVPVEQVFTASIAEEVHRDLDSAAVLTGSPVSELMRDAITAERVRRGVQAFEVVVLDYQILSDDASVVVLFENGRDTSEGLDRPIAYYQPGLLRPAAYPAIFDGEPVSDTAIRWHWTLLPGSVKTLAIVDPLGRQLVELGPTIRDWVEDGLARDTAYTRRLIVTSEDDLQAVSPFKTVRTLATPVRVPYAPFNLRGQAVSPTEILWSWEFDDAAEGFELLDADTGIVIARLTSGERSFIERGLKEDTLYRRQIHAYNEIGASDPSNVAEVRTLKADPLATVPPAPKGLYATILRDNRVRWNWQFEGEADGFWLYSSTGERVALVAPDERSYEEELPSGEVVGRYVIAYKGDLASSMSNIAWVILSDQSEAPPSFQGETTPEPPVEEDLPYVQSGVAGDEDLEVILPDVTEYSAVQAVDCILEAKRPLVMSVGKEVPFRYRIKGKGERITYSHNTQASYQVKAIPEVEGTVRVHATSLGPMNAVVRWGGQWTYLSGTLRVLFTYDTLSTPGIEDSFELSFTVVPSFNWAEIFEDQTVGGMATMHLEATLGNLPDDFVGFTSFRVELVEPASPTFEIGFQGGASQTSNPADRIYSRIVEVHEVYTDWTTVTIYPGYSADNPMQLTQESLADILAPYVEQVAQGAWAIIGAWGETTTPGVVIIQNREDPADPSDPGLGYMTSEASGSVYSGVAVFGPFTARRDRGRIFAVDAEALAGITLTNAQGQVLADTSKVTFRLESTEPDLVKFTFEDGSAQRVGPGDVYIESLVEGSKIFTGTGGVDGFVSWNMETHFNVLPFEGASGIVHMIPLSSTTRFEAARYGGIEGSYGYWSRFPGRVIRDGWVESEGIDTLVVYIPEIEETEPFTYETPWYHGRTRISAARDPVAVPIFLGLDEEGVRWDRIEVEFESSDPLQTAWQNREDPLAKADPHGRLTKDGSNILWVWSLARETKEVDFVYQSHPVRSKPVKLRFGETRETEVTFTPDDWPFPTDNLKDVRVSIIPADPAVEAEVVDTPRVPDGSDVTLRVRLTYKGISLLPWKLRVRPGYYYIAQHAYFAAPNIFSEEILLDEEGKGYLTYFPEIGTPVMVKDQDGSWLYEVPFVDGAGKPTLEASFTYQGNGSRVLELGFADVVPESLVIEKDGKVFNVMRIDYSRAILWEEIPEGEEVKVRFKVRNSFVVHRHDSAVSPMIEVYGHANERVTVYYQPLGTSDALDTEIDANPLRSKHSSKLLYISRTTPGPLASLKIEGALEAPADGKSELAVWVRAQDSRGNPIAGVEVALTASMGHVTPARQVTDSEGVATFHIVSPNTPGVAVLQATSGQIFADARVVFYAVSPYWLLRPVNLERGDIF